MFLYFNKICTYFEDFPKHGLHARRVGCLALAIAALQASPATLEDALRLYPTLEESKAMAVSFSDEPMAFSTGGQASDVNATMSALGACERARLSFGSDRPCEIVRLNDALASSSADIKAGVEGGHPLFMWRYENGSTRLHLVGSIHVLKAALYPIPKRIETAFRHADHVVVEVDVMNVDPAEVARTFARFALLTDGAGIEEVLSPAQRDLLSDELRLLGIGIEAVAQLKPLFLATQLSVARLATFGYLPNYGLEAHFLSRLGNRTLHELETIEQQLALLASPSMEDQVEMLVNTLQGMAEIEPTVAQMVRAWFLGDDGELLRLFEQYTAGSDADRRLLESLIYERNVTLAAGIKDILAKPGTWFVIVGAGHLPGPRGIVALLEAEGIQGHRVMSKRATPGKEGQ